MRINFVLAGLKFGGGMKILVSLAEHLALNGHSVSITSPDDPRQLNWTSVDHIKFIQVPLKRGFFYRIARRLHGVVSGSQNLVELSYWDEISAFLRSLPQSDVCIATSPLTAIALALSDSHVVAFNYLQHYEPLIFTEPLMNRFAVLSPRLPLKVIANSTWLKNHLTDDLHVDPHKIVVQPSAVDTNVFYPRKSDSFPRTPNKKRIVMMGKPHPWKGFNDAMEAMKIVYRTFPDVEWFVYAAKDEFKKDVTAPYTLFTGIEGDSLAELLSSADIIVVPSWYESSPLPVLEALACGTALVTTSLGTEDLVQDKINAIVVPPKEPSLMANAILSLLNDDNLRQRLSQKGLISVQAFTWKAMTKRIEQVFTDALGESK